MHLNMKQSEEGINHTHREYNHTNRTIKNNHATIPKRIFHSGDDSRQTTPPQHRATENGEITPQCAKRILRHSEGELRKKCNKEEDDERIGKRKKERSHKIVHQIATFMFIASNRLEGIT